MVRLTNVNKHISLPYKHKISCGKKLDKINLTSGGIKQNLLKAIHSTFPTVSFKKKHEPFKQKIAFVSMQNTEFMEPTVFDQQRVP